MSDALDTVLAREEDTNRKAWCEPALTEYDVEQVTASFSAFMEDGGLMVS